MSRMTRHSIVLILGAILIIGIGCHSTLAPSVNSGPPTPDTLLEKMHYCSVVLSGIPAKYNTSYSSFSQMGSTNRSDTVHKFFSHYFKISDTLPKIHGDTISFAFSHIYGIVDCSNAYGTHSISVKCVVDKIHSLLRILQCQDYSSLQCGYPGGGLGGSNTSYTIVSVFPDPIPFQMLHDSLIVELKANQTGISLADQYSYNYATHVEGNSNTSNLSHIIQPIPDSSYIKIILK
jgi:hypothetical protein